MAYADLSLAAADAVDAIRPGYKQTEVGVIPEDWKIERTAEFAAIQTGPFGTLLKASEYSAGDGVPLISVSEIREGFLQVTDNTPRVSHVVIKRLPQYLLREGDVVFGRKGAVERSAIIRESQIGWFLGSDGIRIRSASGYNDEYLAVQYQSKRVRSWLLQNATGTTMASLNQLILGAVVVPFPPSISEQEAIAEALRDADALIESLQHLIAKKRQIKQGAMQALLTGRQRLPGFTKAWASIRLGDVANFYKGKGLPKSALDLSGIEPCIHYGELFTHYGETIHKTISRTNLGADCFRSNSNDVLMPTSDVTPTGLARASCVSLNGIILGGDILVIRPDSRLVNGTFLSYVIRLEREQILQLVTGSTVFHLYASDMRKFTFALPALDEQNSIVEVLDSIENEIAALEGRLNKTREIKQGMMQALLTGAIRLPLAGVA